MIQSNPQHVAIIMDGNGRWARKRGLPRSLGHRAGIKTVRKVIEAASELGIKYLTLYAFSTENWARPKTEIKALMSLLKEYISKEGETLKKNGIKLSIFGELSDLPEDVRAAVLKVVSETSQNRNLFLNIALNYGSRQEIIRAVNGIIKDGNEKIDEELFGRYLYTKDTPDPDLLIRTSGEYRISNFLLWQIAYSEIYITDKLWPDFGKKEFIEAINDYKRRARRFGGI